LDINATGSVVSAASASAAALGAWQPGSILRLFIGDGTAENPNGGVLIGNGYTWTGYAGVCTTGACTGGNGGLIGDGGGGYNGGGGGSSSASVPRASSAASALALDSATDADSGDGTAADASSASPVTARTVRRTIKGHRTIEEKQS
jgi:hypothetical protein